MPSRAALRGAASGLLRRPARRSQKQVPLHLLQSAAGNPALRFYSSRQGWDPWDPDGDGGPWGSLDAQADAPADQQPLVRPSSSPSTRTLDSATPPRSAQSWSSYMGDGDGEDSPWTSLDAIADGAEHLAVPFQPSHSPKPPSTRPRSGLHSPLQSEPRVVHDVAPPRSPPLDAFRQRPTRAPPSSPAGRLTHVDPGSGEASMVDVSAKASSSRSATASARVYIPASVVPLIRASSDASAAAPAAPQSWRNKGPVLHTAQLAGIMAAKRTADLIPLCHPLALSHVEVHLEVVESAAAPSSQPDLSGLPGQSTDGGFGLDALGADEAWDEPSSSPEERAWIAKQLADIDGGDEAGLGASAGPQAGEVGEAYISVRCTARTSGPTGVEMEALTGASVACLTLWDMLKSVGGRTMRIDGLCVTAKAGGKSGDWTRDEQE